MPYPKEKQTGLAWLVITALLLTVTVLDSTFFWSAALGKLFGTNFLIKAFCMLGNFLLISFSPVLYPLLFVIFCTVSIKMWRSANRDVRLYRHVTAARTLTVLCAIYFVARTVFWIYVLHTGVGLH